MTAPSEEALDGNAAAGVLSEVFAMDVTAAIGHCAGCGQQSPLGATVAYLQAPGVVLRCRGCDYVLVRVVTSPDRQWVDISGLAVLEVSRPAAGA
jgi:hypothetical protein